MDTDSDGDISTSEGFGSDGSTDSDSSDDDDVDDVMMMADDAEGDDPVDGDDPVGDLQGVEDDDHDHTVPPVIPAIIIEDEVAPMQEPDHEVPVDVEDEEEDPEEDPIVDLEDAPLVQLDPYDIDLDDEPIEIIDVIDDALPEEADLEDDDDEDVDIDGLDGGEFAPGWLLEGMMFGDFDPWFDCMPADMLTVPEDTIPPIVTDYEADFYASLR